MSQPHPARPTLPKVTTVPAEATRVLAHTRLVIPADAVFPFADPIRLESSAGNRQLTPFVASRMHEVLTAATAYRLNSEGMARREQALMAVARALSATVKKLSARTRDLEARVERVEAGHAGAARELREERARRQRMEELYEHDVRRAFDVITCPEVFEPTAPRRCAQPDPAGEADLARDQMLTRAALDAIGLTLRTDDAYDGDAGYGDACDGL